MSKQNKGALSSNTVQEKLSQGLAANKNSNRSRYVASRLPARGAGVANKATPHKNNHEKVTHSTLNSASNVSGVSVVAVLPQGTNRRGATQAAPAGVVSTSAGTSTSTKVLNVATGQVKTSRPAQEAVSVAVVGATAATAAVATAATASVSAATAAIAIESEAPRASASGAVSAVGAVGAATGGLWAGLAELKRKWGGMLWSRNFHGCSRYRHGWCRRHH